MSRRMYEQDQEINWKAEYIARNAEISMHWLKRPRGKSSTPCLEVHGASTFNKGRSLITAFNGGRIGIWDISHYIEQQDVRRSILKTTSESSVFQDPGSIRNLPISHFVSSYTESISVDDSLGNAYVASSNAVAGIDINTLAVIGRIKFQSPVTALSAISANVPMTVATDDGLHIHDPRNHSAQSVATAPTSHDTPSILSILHRGPHAIHVAGRFPSIVTYDRRYLSKVHSTIWSGAHALTSLSELPASRYYPHGGAILAAGQYKSQHEKGSLEIYDPDPLKPFRNGIFTSHQSNRNRSRYYGRKLLYAIPHGCRIVCSDSDGHLTWVERDGRPRLRQWALPPKGEEAMARKIMRLGSDPEDPRADLAIWTGTAVGIVGFGTSRLDAKAEEEENEEEDVEEDERKGKEHQWRELMRRELHRQAEDLRYMSSFGLFSSDV